MKRFCFSSVLPPPTGASKAKPVARKATTAPRAPERPSPAAKPGGSLRLAARNARLRELTALIAADAAKATDSHAAPLPPGLLAAVRSIDARGLVR